MSSIDRRVSLSASTTCASNASQMSPTGKVIGAMPYDFVKPIPKWQVAPFDLPMLGDCQ